jgi:hypothetical protein
MDVCSTFIPDLELPEAVEPGVRALDNPTMTAESLLRLYALAGNARRDTPPPQSRPVLPRFISLVGVQFGGTSARSSAGTLDRMNRVNRQLQRRRLIDIGCCQHNRERDALTVDHNMALRALFSAIRWILPGFFAPPGAGTVEASMLARLQSMRSASPSRSNKTWWRRSHTPALCQSRRRRQQVIPLPQPISWGSISQGIPLRRTKRMPAKTARSGTRGRPPFAFGFSGGNRGLINSQSVSSRWARISRPRITRRLFCCKTSPLPTRRPSKLGGSAVRLWGE